MASDKEVWEDSFKKKETAKKFATKPGGKNTKPVKRKLKIETAEPESSDLTKRLDKIEKDIIMIKKYLNLDSKKTRTTSTTYEDYDDYYRQK